MTWNDLNTLLAALLIHILGGWGLLRLGRIQRQKPPQVIQVDVRKKEVPKPPAPPPPPKVEPPPPPKAKAPKPLPVPQAPLPNETPKEPPKPSAEPPKPLFGASLSSTTTGDSTFSVPVGNTTVGDPKNTAKKGEEVKPLTAVPGAQPGPVFKPASALEIKVEPEEVEGTCRIPYPRGEAYQLGIEGDTVLRVEIEASGKVHNVKLVKGVGYGLDEAAVEALRRRCRFEPARNTAGQAVPYVITYTYHWEMER